MANYRTHVSFGAAVGAITAAVGAIWMPGVGWGVLFLGTFFGFIGGMVPDLDHDGGTALVKITALFSTLLPVVLLAAWGQGEGNWTSWSLLVLLPCHYLLHWGIPQISFGKKKHSELRDAARAVVVAAICALPVLFFFQKHPWSIPVTWLVIVVVAIAVQASVPLFKKITVHRGVFHSIPAIVIYAEVVFLYLYNYPSLSRLWLTGAAFAGALSHLILDEIYSVDFDGAKIRIKRSFGTALKLWDRKYPYSSIGVYVASAIFLVLCVMY